jgi:dGTPase
LYEEDAPTRNDFQRDRDRIVHSSAFRRLVYKTQVFLNHEGDLFRTRLTHSLEVAQLARSMARALHLHEDLVEAMALAHDLGHTPFGHAGQEALNACMERFGGFEHNLQSLRVVDFLEERYASFDGLNLTYETREGILKHCSLPHARQLEAMEPGGVGQRFILREQPSLEAQLCNLSDEIAYNAHDIDDGVRSGLLSMDQLQGVPLVAHYSQETLKKYPHVKDRRWLFETIRMMLSDQVYDVIGNTQEALKGANITSSLEVKHHPMLVKFSEPMQLASLELKGFLSQNLYRHSRVQKTTEQAKEMIRDLFLAYSHDPKEMPIAHQNREDKERAVADYIAGMTDRFAAKEHQRLGGTTRWNEA